MSIRGGGFLTHVVSPSLVDVGSWIAQLVRQWSPDLEKSLLCLCRAAFVAKRTRSESLVSFVKVLTPRLQRLNLSGCPSASETNVWEPLETSGLARGSYSAALKKTKTELS